MSNSPILDQVQLGVGGTRDYTFGPAGHQEEVAAGANVRAEEGGTGNFTEPTYSSDGLLYSLHRSEDGGATSSREHVVYFETSLPGGH